MKRRAAAPETTPLVRTSGGLRLHVNSSGTRYIGACVQSNTFRLYGSTGALGLGSFPTARKAAEAYARYKREKTAEVRAAKAAEAELEDHGQVLSQVECAKICRWAENAIAKNGDTRVRCSFTRLVSAQVSL